MSAQRDDTEKIVVLPICWHSEARTRLSRVVDPEALRAQREMLLASLAADIAELEALQNTTGDAMANVREALSNAGFRKHLDILIHLVEIFSNEVSLTDLPARESERLAPPRD